MSEPTSDFKTMLGISTKRCQWLETASKFTVNIHVGFLYTATITDQCFTSC
jgi:hypothetical protein